MKKLLLTPFLLLALTSIVFAQTDSKKSSKKEMPEKKNVVKLNITSLAFKNIGVQYERALTPKIAVAAQLRFMPKGTPLFYNNLQSQLQEDGSSDVKLGGAHISSFAFTPEFRFYPGKALKGFYLAPYFRFRTLGFGSDITFLDSNKISRLATLDGKITTFAGGLMIGSHFKIGKQFSLDWFILGAHFGSNKGKIAMTVQGSNMTVADQIKLKNDLQQTFDDSKIFKNNTVTTTANSAEVTTTFGMLGLRGFGLNFGYRF